MVLSSTPKDPKDKERQTYLAVGCEISNEEIGTMSSIKQSMIVDDEFEVDKFENSTAGRSRKWVWRSGFKCECAPKCQQRNPKHEEYVVATGKEKEAEPSTYCNVPGHYCIPVSVEMLESSVEDIKKRLSNMSQQPGSGWTIFMTASFWLRHDIRERMQYAVALLKFINFSDMAANDYLRCCKYMQLWQLNEIPEVLQLLKSGKMTNISHRGERGMVAQSTQELTSQQTVVLIIGSKTSKPGMVLMGNAGEKMEWKSAEITSPKIDRAACVALQGVVYVCGGWAGDGSKYSFRRVSNLLWRFDPSNNTWTEMKSMRYGRANHCAVALCDKLFIFGGVDDDGGVMRTTECYDPTMNEWSSSEQMPIPLCAMAACAFNGQAWLAGGLTHDPTGKKGSITDEVLVYNPLLSNSSRWFYATSLRLPRAFACLVTANDTLFLVGGLCNSPDGAVKCVSDLDVLEATEEACWWRHHTDMQRPRKEFATVCIGETLVFLGGVTSDDSLLSSAEIYNTRSGKWTLAAGALPKAVAGLSGVVI